MGKAVMFTITFFLLGSVLLALAFTLFGISQATEQRATEIAINNRINDLSTSISKSYGDLFLESSGVDVSVINNTVSIIEYVPNPRLTNYTTRFNDFKSFIESRERTVTISNGSVNRTRLLIMPVNAMYYNTIIPGDEDNELRYINNFVGVTNVTFYVYAPNIIVDTLDWQEYNLGTINVTAIFQNDSRTISESRLADFSGSGDTFRVTFDSNAPNGDDIDFEVRDGNRLKVFDLRYNTTININITFDTTEILEVYMNNSITINVPEFNITKVTRPRIV